LNNRDLEILVRGPSRSFKLVQFVRLRAVSYSSFYGRIFNRLRDIQRQSIA